MKNILIYTENYAIGGGGNKYMTDVVNSIPEDHKVFLVSNRGGITDVDFKFIKRKYHYEQLDVYTFARIDEAFVAFKNALPMPYKIFRRIYFYLFLFYFQKKNIKIFSALIDTIEPSLIISCDGGYPAALSCLDLIIAGKKKSKRCVLTIVSVPAEKSFIDLFYGKIATIIDRVVVNSNLCKKSLMNSRGFKEEDVIVIYPYIGDRRDGVWDFHKKSREILFAYIGRIEKWKGSYVLLEAFKDIDSRENTRLLMVGSGPELDDIKKYATSLGLGDRVVFTGYLNNISAVLLPVDIFVFPSFWEGMPYSVLEAMNAGKIIISTDVGGIPEVITNKKDGILVRPKNVAELSAAMRDVMMNFDKYAYLGFNAKHKIQGMFTFDIFKENFNKLMIGLEADKNSDQ
jgi:glycosyltransferase involved in cell wall biosynthesis